MIAERHGSRHLMPLARSKPPPWHRIRFQIVYRPTSPPASPLNSHHALCYLVSLTLSPLVSQVLPYNTSLPLSMLFPLLRMLSLLHVTTSSHFSKVNSNSTFCVVHVLQPHPKCVALLLSAAYLRLGHISMIALLS